MVIRHLARKQWHAAEEARGLLAIAFRSAARVLAVTR